MEDEKGTDDVRALVAKNPETGEKMAIAHSVAVQEKMYKISLLLLVVTVAAVILMAVALIKFWPFVLKIDAGQWLSRIMLTCRECAACAAP